MSFTDISFLPDDGLTRAQRSRRNYRRSESRQPTPADLEFLERKDRALLFRGSVKEGEFWRAALRRAGRARGWRGLQTGRSDHDERACWAIVNPPLPNAADPAL